MPLIDTLSDAQRKAVRDLFVNPRVTVRDIPRSTVLALQRRGFIEADPNVMSGLTAAGRALIEELLCHANHADDFAVDDRVERSVWSGGNRDPYTHEWKPGIVVGVGKARLTIRYDDGLTGKAEAYHVRKTANAHQASASINVPDNTPYTYTTIGEGEQRLIIARHTDGDVIVIRMDDPTRFVATSVKGNYDHEREVNEWFVAQMHPHIPEGDKIETTMVGDHAGFREHMVVSWTAIADALDLDSDAVTTTLVIDTIIGFKRELETERKAHAETEVFAQQEHASYNALWEAVRKAYCDEFDVPVLNVTALQAVDFLARAAKEGKALHNAVRSAHGEVYDGTWQEGQSDVDLVQMLARSAQGHKTRAIEKTEANAAVYRQALIEAQESLDTEGARSESIDALLAQSGAGADLLERLSKANARIQEMQAIMQRSDFYQAWQQEVNGALVEGDKYTDFVTWLSEEHALAQMQLAQMSESLDWRRTAEYYRMKLLTIANADSQVATRKMAHAAVYNAPEWVKGKGEAN